MVVAERCAVGLTWLGPRFLGSMMGRVCEGGQCGGEALDNEAKMAIMLFVLNVAEGHLRE